MESEISGHPETWTRQILTYLALTLGLAVLFKYLFTSRVPANIPPFPAKAYPILGHLPYLTNGVRDQMAEWNKSTGEIFSLYFGPKLVVILSSYKVLHEAYIKHAGTLSDRPDTLSGNYDGEDPNTGISTSSGKHWKEQRSVTMHILKSFGLGKNLLALKISEEVSAYTNALSELSGEPGDIRELTKTAVSNILCSILVGKRFDYDDAFYNTFITKMQELIQINGAFSMFSMFPWLRHLRHLPGDIFNAKKRTGISKYIDTFFCQHYIDKTKNEDDEFNKENFISAYLHEKRKLENQGHDTTLDERNLSRIIFELFVAGTDSTATAIHWFMIYMLYYPDIQEKIFAEISDNVGLERQPNMHDRTKLNLLVATIMEVQRVAITPINVPHTSRRDTEVGGYTIPAGTIILPYQDSYILNEGAWTEPLKFKPERFLDDQGTVTQPEQFIPFGIGRRSCPGEALARMELYLFLSSLVQRFELRPAVPGQLPSLKPVEGLVYVPEPFKIRFVDRRGL